MQDWGEQDPRWRGIHNDVVPVAGRGAGTTDVNVLRAGDDAPGTPQLLVHGLGGSASNWLEVMGALAEQGPVVAVDLPGFGWTEPPMPRAARLEPQARFLHRLLDELGWDRAVVHGNSMGGLLSVLLAADHPDRVDRLVLTSPALPPPRTKPFSSTRVAMQFAPFLSWRFGAMVMKQLYARTPTERLRQETLQLILGDRDDVGPAMQQVQREHLEASRTHPWRIPSFAHAAGDIVHVLGATRRVHRAILAVQAPTLIVWGDQDVLVSGDTMDLVLTRRADWDRVDLDGVGHAGMLEEPDRWLEAVTRWQAGRPATAAASGQ